MAGRSVVRLASLVAAAAVGGTTVAFADGPGSIKTSEIVRHVVPKDAIPALVLPEHVAVEKATFLRAGDRVIAVEFGGEAVAYPTRILEHHEVVNDLVGGRPIVVTY
jgi:hypothetical protein